MSTKAIEGYSALQRGDKDYNVKNYKGAIELYNSAINYYKEADQDENTTKNTAVAKNNLSIAYNEYGKDFANIWGSMKPAAQSQETLKKAIEAFTKATEAKPDSAPAHYNLGLTHEKNNDHVNATIAYKKSLDFLPKTSTIDTKEIGIVVNTHCKIII